MNKINRIVVVGGGTAGLVAASMLKTRFNAAVSLIYSSKEPIVGVGEGSTEHWIEYCRYVGINMNDLIKECDATYKAGVMFENWNQQSPYFHAVQGDQDTNSYRIDGYNAYYAKLIVEGKIKQSQTGWDSKIASSTLSSTNSPINQLHFNTYKLNEFLKRQNQRLGVALIDDRIEDVVLKESGEIQYLVGENGNYEYDFYVDATGFKKILISKLGAKWQSASKYMFVNSAITFPTEIKETEKYNLWTLARGMDSGWMFRLPVWGRYGNGYIFNDSFIEEDKAIDEITKYFGYTPEISKKFKFDPGWLDNAWIKNCFAVGLSGSFMEPLEATSIGSTIQLTGMFMDFLPNYDSKTIELYNKKFHKFMENIRDFISLHYICGRTDTDFWMHVKETEVPDSLKEKLEIWKTHLPKFQHFENTGYDMFTADNFTLVLDGLGLFDIQSIEKEYEYMQPQIKSNLSNFIDRVIDYVENDRTIDHKEYLEAIKKYF